MLQYSVRFSMICFLAFPDAFCKIPWHQWAVTQDTLELAARTHEEALHQTDGYFHKPSACWPTPQDRLFLCEQISWAWKGTGCWYRKLHKCSYDGPIISLAIEHRFDKKLILLLKDHDSQMSAGRLWIDGSSSAKGASSCRRHLLCLAGFYSLSKLVLQHPCDQVSLIPAK